MFMVTETKKRHRQDAEIEVYFLNRATNYNKLYKSHETGPNETITKSYGI